MYPPMYSWADHSVPLFVVCCKCTDKANRLCAGDASAQDTKRGKMTLEARIGDVLGRAAGFVEEYVQRIGTAQAAEKLSYWSGRSVVDLYVRLALDLDIAWRAPLPEGPKIVAVNHPTTTDPFYMLAVIPEQMSLLITDMAFAVPGFGDYLQTAGHIPVIVDKGRLAFEQAGRFLKAGRTIGIFPEGALSPLGSDLGFHVARTGTVRLALSTGTPIIPVGISLDQARIRFSRTEAGGRSEMARWYLGGPYAVTVGEAMYCDGDIEDREYVRSVSQRMMQHIAWLARSSARRLDRSRREMDRVPGLFQRGQAEGV